MKRFIFVFLIFNFQIPTFNLFGLKAQEHVEQAFDALRTAGGGTLILVCYPSRVLGECKSRCDEFRFTLPISQREVVEAVYQAFDRDRLWCTQYRRQDAHSAHNRPVDIQVPSCRLQLEVDDHVNLLWGGFFNKDGETGDFRLPDDSVFHAGLTLYRYYVLTWSFDVQGNISGTMRRITFVADTQCPDVRPVREPSYAPLVRAFDAFTSRTDVAMSRSLSFRRAAANGQWTHIYHTYGFNIPIREEQNLLLPLYEAFEETKHRSYRSLNKPAGTLAQDVQIVVNEQGGTIGLGLQQDWNIVYAYFNDEDYPQNRYVYALWYKSDVPRQRIVGELIEINTLRPDGGQVVEPFVQTKVPAYLWRMHNPLLASLNLNGEEQAEDISPYVVEWVGTPSNDFELMQYLLRDFEDMDLGSLRFDLDTLMQRRMDEMDAMNVEMANLQELYRESLKGLSGMLKINVEDYARMSPQERKDYNDIARKSYQAELERVNEMYREYFDNVGRRHNIADYEIFRRDSLPSDVFRRSFLTFVRAYRGDGSNRDAQVAERLRQMAGIAEDKASRAVRLDMVQKLDSLWNLPNPGISTQILTIPRQSLAEATITLRDILVATPTSVEVSGLHTNETVKALSQAQRLEKRANRRIRRMTRKVNRMARKVNRSSRRWMR